MPSNTLISLSSVSNVRLEQFRTQYELAKNFYDDYEFCPVFHVEEATEHRERVQRRTSPYPSPNLSISSSSSSSTSSSYYTSSKQHHYYQHTPSRSNSSSTATVAAAPNATRAIPIIDPSNMTPVAVPAHITTSPSMAQWVSYKSTTSPVNTSPSSVHSSLSSNSSSSTSSGHATDYHQNYHYNTGSSYQQPMVPPTVIRAIPIIDPSTRQAYHQQQHQHHHHHHQIHHHHHHQSSQTVPPPGFYNVSVC
ncbi:hypothetical protein MBANPS3_011761 [Mucor bainieri]